MSDEDDLNGPEEQIPVRPGATGPSRPDDEAIGATLSEPMRTAYRDWVSANAAWIAAIAAADGVETGASDDEATSRRRAVRIVAEGRAITPADFAAVLHVWWEEHGPHMLMEDPILDDEDLDPSCVFVARAWRSATGLTGWPRVL